MQKFLTNWKTTVTGVTIIGLGALNTFVGIKVPGFSLDFGAALAMGIGLLLAQDAQPTS